MREALLELQKDGYVSFSRGKGVQVVPVSDRDARDILETRMYIECINAKLAANRAAQRDLQAMRESLDRLRDQLSTRDGQHLYRLDHIFHRAVAAATQNRLLYRECELLLDHYLRFEVKNVICCKGRAQAGLSSCGGRYLFRIRRRGGTGIRCK